MLSSGLVNNLDNLAREGIIDFDASAFITGTKPRYIGNPNFQQQLPMPEMSDVDTSNLQQPSKDEMVYNDPEKNETTSKNPLWKKFLFGTIAGGLAIFGGVKLYKFCKTNSLKNLFSKVPDFFKKTGNSIKNFFTTGWDKFKGLFKGKTS